MSYDRAPSISSGKSPQQARKLSSEYSQNSINSKSPSGTDSPQVAGSNKELSPSKQKNVKRFNTMKFSTNFLAELKQGIEHDNSMEQKEKPQAPSQNQSQKLISVTSLLKNYQQYADSPMRKFGEYHSTKQIIDNKVSRKTSDSFNSPSVKGIRVNFNSDAPELDSDVSIESRNSKHSNISAPAPVISNFYEASNANDSNIHFSDLSSADRSNSNSGSAVNSPSMNRTVNILASPCGKSAFFKPRLHNGNNQQDTNEKSDSEEEAEGREEEYKSEKSEIIEMKPGEDDSFVKAAVTKHSRNMSSSILDSKLHFGSPLVDSQMPIRKGKSPTFYGTQGTSLGGEVKPLVPEKVTMNQLAKNMAKVKIEIDKKKSIMALYEYLFSKAKEMANQEPSLLSKIFNHLFV